jgi:hypothetical protein
LSFNIYIYPHIMGERPHVVIMGNPTYLLLQDRWRFFGLYRTWPWPNLAGPIIFMDFYHQLLRMIIVCQARVHVCLMAMDLYICLGWLLMKIHDGFMIIPFKLLSSWWHCNPLELFVKYIIWSMRMCLEEMWFSD